MRAWMVVLAVAIGGPALAAQFPGWGDTGFTFYSKRDCCAEAIALAQEDSAARCVTSGGIPKPTSGTRRGSCQWEWTTDASYRQVYRCVSEAAVWCR